MTPFGCNIGKKYTAPQWATDAALLQQVRATSYTDSAQRAKGLDSDTARAMATDYFSNPLARMGHGTPNIVEGSEYNLCRFSYNYMALISLYRNSWISRRIVDCPANDMVRAWPKLTSDVEPEDLDRIDNAIRVTQTKQKMLKALKWARLFGGAGCLIVIAGHEDHLDEPLDLEEVEPGSYKGLIPFDRWTGISSSGPLSTDFTKPLQFGLPTHYHVQCQGSESFDVHASRILRFLGPEVPTPEYEAQQYWGISVLEPAFEEIRKRDNMSWNILMLTFRAQILGIKYPELAQILSGLGMNQQAAQQWYTRMQSINDMMSNQSLLLLPKDGDLQAVNYTFSGLSEVYQQFQLDISGASEIPVTRLFGRTITGLGQANEADEKMYEERIAQEQDVTLRPNHDILFRVICRSELGEEPKDLNLQYPSIRVMDDKEKAELAGAVTTSTIAAFNSGLFNRPMALREIQQSSTATGFGTNITNDDIAAAEEEEKMAPEMGMPEGQPGEGGPPKPPSPGGAPQPPKPKPSAQQVEFSPLEHLRQQQGKALDSASQVTAASTLPIRVETHPGQRRIIRNSDGKRCYDRLLPCGYGHIRGTQGRDGDCIDVLIGPVKSAKEVYVVDMQDLGPDIGAREDEDKVLVHFAGPKTARKAFNAAYGEDWIRDWKTYSYDAFVNEYLKPCITDAAVFKEDEHPRDKSGKFSTKGARGEGAPVTKSVAPFTPKHLQDASVAGVKRQLEQLSRLGIKKDDFILKHGKQCYMNENSFQGRRGTPKDCYRNALMLAISDDDLTYVEGMVDIGPLAVEHAWCVDSEGSVVDPTLPAPKAGDRVAPRGYFGVPFNTRYIEKVARKTKVSGVLSHTNPLLLEGKVPLSEFSMGPTPVELKPGQSTEEALRDPVTKQWEPNREKWHRQITNELLEGKTPQEHPVAYITGGGMASGKSALSRYAQDTNRVHIDPDQMKEKIPEFEGLKTKDPPQAATRVHEESSYMSKHALAGAVAKRLNVYYDSSGSGKSTLGMVAMLHKEGYAVHVLFADTSQEEASKRAASRALKTGRATPPEVLAASHLGASANFQKLQSAPGVVSMYLYDTTGAVPKLVYSRIGNSEEEISDPKAWASFQKKGKQ